MNDIRDHRRACRLHMLRRCAERGLPATAIAIFKLERRIERMRAAFERPGEHRYRIVVLADGHRWRVVYDTELRCCVTLLEGGAFYGEGRAEY